MSIVEGEIKKLFGGPVDQVAANVADTWSWHENRKLLLPGIGQTLIIRAGSTNRFYRWKYAIAYSHEYTMQRWPNSRGPEIRDSETADIIGYPFHQYILPFVKIGAEGSAANLQIAEIREVDRFGDPIQGNEDEMTLKSAKISDLLGLRDRGRAFIAPVDLKGNRALLLAAGTKQMSPEELKSIEEDILSELL